MVAIDIIGADLFEKYTASESDTTTIVKKTLLDLHRNSGGSDNLLLKTVLFKNFSNLTQKYIKERGETDLSDFIIYLPATDTKLDERLSTINTYYISDAISEIYIIPISAIL